MIALLGMDRYQKEVIQVSTWKNDKKVYYLYDKASKLKQMETESI